MEPKMDRLEEKRSWKGSKVSMKSRLGCKGIRPGWIMSAFPRCAISRGLGQATGWCEESVEKRVSLNSDMSMSVSSSESSSMGTGVFQPSPCLCQYSMSSS